MPRLLFLLALLLVLAGVTRIGSWLIERRNPPVGSFMTSTAQAALRHVPAETNSIVFIPAHANLNDQIFSCSRFFSPWLE